MYIWFNTTWYIINNCLISNVYLTILNSDVKLFSLAISSSQWCLKERPIGIWMRPFFWFLAILGAIQWNPFYRFSVGEHLDSKSLVQNLHSVLEKFLRSVSYLSVVVFEQTEVRLKLPSRKEEQTILLFKVTAYTFIFSGYCVCRSPIIRGFEQL